MPDVIKPENRNMTASIISDVTGNVYWICSKTKLMVYSVSSVVEEPPEYYYLICARLKMLDDFFNAVVEDNRIPEEPEGGWNYIVTIGRKDYGCMTAEEAWKCIGKRSFFMGYTVSSPKGLDVSDFIPY